MAGAISDCSLCENGKAIQKPATVPCGHTFCYLHLLTWAGKHKKFDGERWVANCPTCELPFDGFTFKGNKWYQLYAPGMGPNGQLKRKRKYRPRRNQRRRGAGKKGGDKQENNDGGDDGNEGGGKLAGQGLGGRGGGGRSGRGGRGGHGGHGISVY